MKRTDIKAGDRITVAAVVESEGHDDQHVIARIGGTPVQVPIPDGAVICLPVPPRVYAKLREIAGSSSVENWARRVLIDAAEEASPSLRDSGMWCMDTGAWYSLLNPADDEGADEAEMIAEGILTEGQVAVRRANEGWHQ